jgi:hypothetical protein
MREIVAELRHTLSETVQRERLVKLGGAIADEVREPLLERRIPFIKWGHFVRFDPVEIRDWVDRCRHRPGGSD